MFPPTPSKLPNLSRKELQKLAKQHGIRANLKTAVIVCPYRFQRAIERRKSPSLGPPLSSRAICAPFIGEHQVSTSKTVFCPSC